jgi:hypothetical protein
VEHQHVPALRLSHITLLAVILGMPSFSSPLHMLPGLYNNVVHFQFCAGGTCGSVSASVLMQSELDVCSLVLEYVAVGT